MSLRIVSAAAACMLVAACGDSGGAPAPPTAAASVQAVGDNGRDCARVTSSALTPPAISPAFDPAHLSRPEAAARRAIAEGRHGLVFAGMFARPVGVVCQGQPRASPAPEGIQLFNQGFNDTPAGNQDEENRLAVAGRRDGDRASRYNRTLVEHPLYPFRDVCRASTGSASASSVGESRFDPISWGRPAQSFGPIRTLGDAARHGDSAEVRRRLGAGEDVDQIDGFSMTPLSWAIARDNGEVIRTLVAGGAEPLGSCDARVASPLYTAAAFGRNDLFEQMATARVRRALWPILTTLEPNRPVLWPHDLIEAAVDGGNAILLRRLLNEPHAPGSAIVDEPPWNTPARRDETFIRPLLTRALLLDRTEAVEVLLQSREATPDSLLAVAVNVGSTTMVQRALRAGADVRAPERRGEEPLLHELAMGRTPQAGAMARLLIAAGADPNGRGAGMSVLHRTSWRFEARSNVDRRDATDAERLDLLDALLDGGAAYSAHPSWRAPPWVNLLDVQTPGRPRAPAPLAWLTRLHQSGYDFSGRYNGQTALEAVAAAEGPTGPTARHLRRLLSMREAGAAASS